MLNEGLNPSTCGIEKQGLKTEGTVYWHLPPARLYEQAIRRQEGVLAQHGPLVAWTGEHTGRSPNDRFQVKESTTGGDVWWGDVNRPIDGQHFDALFAKIQEYVADRDLFVFDGYAGADPHYRLRVRVINEFAWHNLFVQNMFVRESDGDALTNFEPEFTVIGMPGVKADPSVNGTNSSTFIIVNIEKRMVIVGGSAYAGEMKKSIFSVMNYLLPKRGVLSMHCSCNYGQDQDDVALFFGLSGTGKTTLSADNERTLIGDDEHGWSDNGVFNIEGGCYAKVIRLSPTGEPEIYATTRRFGTVLENVALDPWTGELDLDDAKYTENTRASYPLTQLEDADLDGRAGHPKHVVFLTCDAFGVLPPISRLTAEQASYHFLSGYTAKVAGTERGVKDPSATFSACFGAPFMPLHPGVYADMLAEKTRQHGAQVWLVNTGWTGGPFGVGERMSLAHTRRMVRAALGGELDNADFVEEPFFGLAIPSHVEGVPAEVLQPKSTWTDAAAYDEKAAQLAAMFRDNFKKYQDGVSAEVKAAGPRV